MPGENDFLGHFADLQKMRRRQLTTLDVNVRHEVHEHRAPTDQSVALLREMEREAESKLIAVVGVNTTQFSFATFVFDQPGNPFEIRLRIKFSLGEKPYDFDFPIPADCATSKYNLWQKIRERVAKEIADRILLGSFSELVKHHSLRP